MGSAVGRHPNQQSDRRTAISRTGHTKYVQRDCPSPRWFCDPDSATYSGFRADHVPALLVPHQLCRHILRERAIFQVGRHPREFPSQRNTMGF